MNDNRFQQIKSNYEKIQSRITEACKHAGRKTTDITLIAVTKTYPAQDIDLLNSLGIENVGENKDQEASQKFKEVNHKYIWHFVGQLQTNKVKSVIQYADFIHSVDRISLVKEIQKSCQKINKIQKVLIQIDLDESTGDENRGGVVPNQLINLATEIASCPNIALSGLMSVAPLNESAESAFSRLQNIQKDFLKNFPDALMLSAGMSEDLEAAILHGATHLRIGSALLGERPKIG